MSARAPAWAEGSAPRVAFVTDAARGIGGAITLRPAEDGFAVGAGVGDAAHRP